MGLDRRRTRQGQTLAQNYAGGAPANGNGAAWLVVSGKGKQSADSQWHLGYQPQPIDPNGSSR